MALGVSLTGRGEQDWAGDPKAIRGSPNKQRLYRFLVDNYGKRVITGQTDVSWSDSPSMDMIARVYALKGFDYLNIQNVLALEALPDLTAYGND
jgi:hypothetical protein